MWVRAVPWLPCPRCGPSAWGLCFQRQCPWPQQYGALLCHLFSSSRPSQCVCVCVCLHVFKWCELFRIKKCTQMRRFYTPDKLVHFLYKMWVFLHEIPGTAACSREVTPRSPAAGRVCRVDSGWHHRPARPRTRAGAPSVLAAVGSWWRVQLFIALTVGLLRIPPHGARCETKGPMTPL